MGDASPGLDRLGRFGQCRAFGQGSGDLGGDGLGFLAAKVTDQGDHRVASGIGLGVEGAQLLKSDAWYALGAAIAWLSVRVIAVELTEQRLAGDLARVLFLILETGQQLVLDAFQGVFREGWLAGHFGEQLEGGLAFVPGAQAAQRGHGHVAIGTVAKVSTQALEALGDGGHVLAGHALVEHGVGQAGQARGVAVLAAASGESHAQVEHRQLAGLDEQDPGAFGGGPVLDVQLAPAGCLAIKLGQRLQGVGRAGGAAFGLGMCRPGEHGGHGHYQRDDARADQGVAWCAAITHERTPQAVHGQRLGVRG